MHAVIRCTAVTALFVASMANATIINAPEDQPTIQAGIVMLRVMGIRSWWIQGEMLSTETSIEIILFLE